MMTEEQILEMEKQDELEAKTHKIFPVRAFAQAEAILERHFAAQTDGPIVRAELMEKVLTVERVDAINKLNHETDPTSLPRTREDMAEAMMDLYAQHQLIRRIKAAFGRARVTPAPQDMPQPTHPGNGTYLI